MKRAIWERFDLFDEEHELMVCFCPSRKSYRYHVMNRNFPKDFVFSLREGRACCIGHKNDPHHPATLLFYEPYIHYDFIAHEVYHAICRFVEYIEPKSEEDIATELGLMVEAIIESAESNGIAVRMRT